ncbi:HET-domain-containing protein [Xylaria acuta]|nr:HET-domain-containing protein [Xylaria acuta]
MHLLNVYTRQLQEFIGDRIPPYAILSHTWGEDEVLFQDLSTPGHKKKPGYQKIEGCCQQAILDGFEFVWVDTCCIDKRSSAELSEAINSMFRWYGDAQVCYVYLIDVLWEGDSKESSAALRKSKWFTRGWTLQELISPVALRFFDTRWSIMFRVDKNNIGWPDDNTPYRLIEEVTGIRSWYKYSIHSIHTELNRVPVTTKLSWVSGRHTTRVEDMAYCLLGLLDVNMPLLYGEGHKSFLRLQEEFLKKHHDPTVVCWGFGMNISEIKNIQEPFGPSCLAPTPLLFRGFRNVDLKKMDNHPNGAPRLGWIIAPRGLQIELPVVQFDARNSVYIGVTDYHACHRFLAIPLYRYSISDAYVCVPNCGPFLLGELELSFNPHNLKRKTVYLDSNVNVYYNPALVKTPTQQLNVDMTILYENGFVLDSIYPPAIVRGSRVCFMNEAEFLKPKYLNLVLRRKQGETLFLRFTCPIRKPWGGRGLKGYKMRLFHPRPSEERSALEVWDAGRRAWERSFQGLLQLDWKKTIVLGGNRRLECISKWGCRKWWIDGPAIMECAIDVQVMVVDRNRKVSLATHQN